MTWNIFNGFFFCVQAAFSLREQDYGHASPSSLPWCSDHVTTPRKLSARSSFWSATYFSLRTFWFLLPTLLLPSPKLYDKESQASEQPVRPETFIASIAVCMFVTSIQRCTKCCTCSPVTREVDTECWPDGFTRAVDCSVHALVLQRFSAVNNWHDLCARQKIDRCLQTWLRLARATHQPSVRMRYSAECLLAVSSGKH